MAEMGRNDAKTKLIINYLPQTLTDKELYSTFANIGPIESCRIMRDFKTGYSFGYGFVTYSSEYDAQQAINKLNGWNIQDKRLKVSYARPPGDDIKDTNLYIVNLPKHFQEQDLDETFGVYGTIVQKNLLKDKITGMPRGVAFVRYDKKEEAQSAIMALNGTQMSGALMPLQIKLAEEHGKQKAAYFAGLQTGMAMKQQRMPPPRMAQPQCNQPGMFTPSQPIHRGRGAQQQRRFNPISRGGYNPGFYM